MSQIRAVLRSRRVTTDVAALVLLGVVSAVTWIPRLRGPIDLRWDGAAYYILGTSLARGNGYRLLNEPGEIQSVLHPPLLPGLVAIHQLVLGTADWTVVGVWLRMTFFAIFIVYIGAVYVLARAFLPSAYALTVAALTLLHYGTQFLSDLLYAELPFALGTMLFLVWARRDEHRVSWRTGVAAIAVYALRTAGIALLAAWVGDALLRRRFRTALARLAIAMFPVLAWQGYVAAVQSSPAYRHSAYEYQRAPYMYCNVTYATNAFTFKDPFRPELGRATLGDIARRSVRHLRTIPTALGQAVSSNLGHLRGSLTEILRRPLIPPRAVTWFVFGLGCLVMLGSAIHLAGREWMMPLYAVFSIILICLTPFPDQFWRYLVPLTPILSLWLVESLRWLARLPPSRRLRPIPVAGVALGLLLVLQAHGLVHLYRSFHLDATYVDRGGVRTHHRLFYYTPSYRAQDEALDWLKDHAGIDDVLAAPDPHWAYLRTGRQAVLPPFEPAAAEAERLMGTVPVRYVMVQSGAAIAIGRYVNPVIERDPDGWRRVASDIDSGVTVYERTHE